MLTALQEFETTLCCAMSEIEVSRRLRIFLANRALALGWALKGACKPCAHQLFTTVRWLVPEAQRFLVQHISAHKRNRRLFEWLFSRVQPRIVVGFLIVLAFVVALDFTMRTAATDAQPLAENSAFRQESQIRSVVNIVSVSKFSEPMQATVLETGSLPGAQTASVPLPLRKPERVYKAQNGKGAGTRANLTNKKRMAQRHRALPKPKLLLSYPHKHERSAH
jgi:hypothetical protein